MIELNKEEIPDRLRSYRLARAWSQRRMARQLRKDVTTVSKMESGSYKFTDLVVARLLHSLPDLFG